MPARLSRRNFIVTAFGTGMFVSTSGCLSAFRNQESAFLSYKGIIVRWEVDRVQGYVADLCWVWSNGHSRIFGWQPEEYPDIVRSPTNIQVSEPTFQAIQDRFVDVDLVLGFSDSETTDLSLLQSDIGRTHVSREMFNRVQFGDLVTVRVSDRDLSVRDVESGGHGTPAGWDIEIGTKNLVEQFPDRGVPEP